MKNIFRIIIFTLLVLAAFYLYFVQVNTGAPIGGSDDLMYLTRILNEQTEISNAKEGVISITEYGILGYRDVPGGVAIYTLRYQVDYTAMADELEVKTASVVPVVLKKFVDGVEWEVFEDARYKEQFNQLPGTIREILTDGEKHNIVVGELEDTAQAVVQKYLEGWFTYKNSDFGFQIDYPVDWQMNYYTQPIPNSEIIEVAFDPVEVDTSEEHASSDEAPGTVWIYMTDVLPDGSFDQTMIGDVSASFQTYLQGGNRYYLSLPQPIGNYSYVVVETNYPTEKGSDAVLKDILASFKFLMR